MSAEPPKFKGASRFEIELEFVQSLANPWYLNYLASQKFLDQEEILNYINYLQYWKQPEYAKYLQYPGTTIRALQLLQLPEFRRAIIGLEFVHLLIAQGLEAVTKFASEDPLSREAAEPSSTTAPANDSIQSVPAGLGFESGNRAT